MDFKDFINNPQDLVGKTVLYESGTTYSSNIYRCLTTITKVTKTGFRITLESATSTLFSLADGNAKGLTGRQNMARISRCILLTDNQENEYRIKWRDAKIKKALIDEIKSKIESLDIDSLRSIKLLL